MADHSFSKEEKVAFDQLLEGFNDALILSRNISTYRTDATMMARTGDVIWRPRPYVGVTYDGIDQTANFATHTQLSVPATLGFWKSAPWTMNPKELRDALQEQRLNDAARDKLSSDINVSVMSLAALTGTMVVKRTTAASGYDDVAEADAAMNEVGIAMDARYLALSSRDYNKMASNLAARQTMTGKPVTAYERSYVGTVAGFETYKLDYAQRLTAKGATTVAVSGANQYFVPRATSTASTGERANVDNRYQNLTITVGSGTVAVGDCFTIEGVNSVHHITKQDTGQLKTFRVTGIVSGAGGSGVIQISPPIISGGGGSVAELAYQNVSATPGATAAITFLNTVTASVNPFWHRDSLEILPGRYEVPTDAGMGVIRASTDQGIEVTMSKQIDINTLVVKYRLDVFWGLCNKNPEMNGIMLFGQT